MFPDSYLEVQSEALVKAEGTEYQAEDDAHTMITFNRYGNVSLARTMTYSSGSNVHSVIIELGGGRLVFRDCK